MSKKQKAEVENNNEKSKINDDEKVIYSFRLKKMHKDKLQILCDNLGVQPSYVLQELIKDFLVRNLNKDSHESAEILRNPNKEE